MIKPERYTLDGLILTGTFNTADGIATADDGAQAETLAMELADGNLTSSVILFPQTAITEVRIIVPRSPCPKAHCRRATTIPIPSRYATKTLKSAKPPLQSGTI